MGDGFDAATAQNLNSFRGKILRMNLDGSAPADNPFYDAGDGINASDYVFAYGFRNPFGGAWRAADGAHYEVENGRRVDRFAEVVAGRNYGWDGSDAEHARTTPSTTGTRRTRRSTSPSSSPQTFGGSGFPTDEDGPRVRHASPARPTRPARRTRGKRIVEFAPMRSGTFDGSHAGAADRVHRHRARPPSPAWRPGRTACTSPTSTRTRGRTSPRPTRI